jgi:Short-chain dehydrogenases of various substrate specificities
MDLGISGKWALVCGASRGLGWGCAQALVREGVNVLVNARGADALQAAASKLTAEDAGASGATVLFVAADITTPEGRAAVFAAPGGPGRNFDIVVTNAGGPPPGDFGVGVAMRGSAPWTRTCSRRSSSSRRPSTAWRRAASDAWSTSLPVR